MRVREKARKWGNKKDKKRGKEKNTNFFLKRERQRKILKFLEHQLYFLATEVFCQVRQGLMIYSSVILFFFSSSGTADIIFLWIPFSMLSSQTLILQELTVLDLFWTKETTCHSMKLVFFFVLIFCKRLIDVRLHIYIYIYSYGCLLGFSKEIVHLTDIGYRWGLGTFFARISWKTSP